MIIEDIQITSEFIDSLPNEVKEVWLRLDYVKDPEIPTMSVIDMGIVRDVIYSDSSIEIIITPTYSGCPAIKVIETDIIKELKKHYTQEIILTNRLSPAWTTDWMTEDAKLKLLESKIAPPIGKSEDNLFNILNQNPTVKCPYCNSPNTQIVSYFGTTACKSLFTCKSCEMPFDYFKCH